MSCSLYQLCNERQLSVNRLVRYSWIKAIICAVHIARKQLVIMSLTKQFRTPKILLTPLCIVRRTSEKNMFRSAWFYFYMWRFCHLAICINASILPLYHIVCTLWYLLSARRLVYAWHIAPYIIQQKTSKPKSFVGPHTWMNDNRGGDLTDSVWLGLLTLAINQTASGQYFSIILNMLVVHSVESNEVSVQAQVALLFKSFL